MIEIIIDIIRIKKRGLLHLKPAKNPLRLECNPNECGLCCRILGNTGKIFVSKEDAKTIDPIFLSIENKREFIRSNGQACVCLINNKCDIYKFRPKGCHEYPWYNINGVLYYDTGCPGIKTDFDDRPSIDTIQEFENFYLFAPKFIRYLLKKMCVLKFI